MPRRCVEDIPLGPYRLFWRFAPMRIRCPHCGKVHVEKIAGLTPHSRQTDRFRAYLAAKCDDASVFAVARDYGLNDDVYTAYLLKEQVIAFYEQKSKGEAEDYLKKWASAG